MFESCRNEPKNGVVSALSSFRFSSMLCVLHLHSVSTSKPQGEGKFLGFSVAVEEVYGVFFSLPAKINNRSEVLRRLFLEFCRWRQVSSSFNPLLENHLHGQIDWEILSLNIIQFPFLIDIMSFFFDEFSLIVWPALFSFHSLGIFSRSILFCDWWNI